MLNGERHFFGEIAPTDIFTRYSYKGAEWQFTASFGSEETGTIHRTVIGEAGTYNINGNHLGQAISAESKTRTVRLSNQSPFEVNIQEKTTDERLGDVLGAIPPGGAKDFTIQVGKTLEARDKYSNHRIAQLVVPHGDGIFNYDIQLKSWNSQHAAKLSIYNRTSILLDVFWLDYDGKEQKITEIGRRHAPGNVFDTPLDHQRPAKRPDHRAHLCETAGRSGGYPGFWRHAQRRAARSKNQFQEQTSVCRGLV